MGGTLWTVETGEYSDHCIHAVFTCEDDAVVFASALDGAEVGTIDWNPDVSMLRNGHKLWEITHNTDNYWWVETIAPNREGLSDRMRTTGTELFYVWSDTKERALKVASERSARYQVEGWPSERAAITVGHNGEARAYEHRDDRNND